jgi:DNA-directed RNA polymerase I, II, and III subunit RPABC1
LMQMLRDRGYFIADSELTMTKQQFIRKHGDNMKRAYIRRLESTESPF